MAPNSDTANCNLNDLSYIHILIVKYIKLSIDIFQVKCVFRTNFPRKERKG